MKSARLGGGGDIKRDKRIAFTFERRTYEGYEGDTLASALIANGISVVGRSFKYHRPRGIMAAGVEEPNALVSVGEGPHREVNLRATEVDLSGGLAARAVNCWPSARFDVGAVNDLIARFIPAGFYYKTFMLPGWRFYEPFIRRAAGLGKPSDAPDPDNYDATYAHTDILIVGAGPAGLAAALAAAGAGIRVMLVEQEALAGGSLRWLGGEIAGRPARAWADAAISTLAASGDIRILTRTTAVGYFDHNEVALLERLRGGAARLRLWRVRAKQVILAAGAIERPLVFPGNDRPGVMLVSGVRRFLGQYAVRAGERLAIFTNNDAACALASAYQAAGGKIAAIIHGGNRAEAPKASGAPLLRGVVIATHGSPALSGVTVRTEDGRTVRIACDALAMSGGWSPSAHLFKQSGGTLKWDDAHQCLRPEKSAQAEQSAGAANGDFGLSAALEGGRRAATKALAALGASAHVKAAPQATKEEKEVGVTALWRVDAPGKAFVDFQNDVTLADINLAAREGYRSVEHLKRYTTLGMAPDQGKTSNVNALALLGEATGRAPAEVGTTGWRFPYTPVPMAAFAGFHRGALFHPVRRMPAHAEHEAEGAVFEEYSGWLRPAYYLRAGETPRDAEQREALAVRTKAGLFESSTLGKIEVKGPDAAILLDRVYANAMSNLKVGKVRYGVMLSEFGVIADDGVCARLADDHFLVCASSAAADKVAFALEELLQCDWPDLDVIVAPVTSAFGAVTITGPRAREILERAGADIGLDGHAFPHMSVRDGRIVGLCARMLRVSFTGEASYEIYVAPSDVGVLWRRVMEAGRPYGLTPIGIDAWMLLRTEKGYFHVGGDTDGTTNALDIGWDHVLKRKDDFIGRRSLMRPADQAADRFQYVGLETLDGSPLRVGGHLRRKGARGGTEGYVTSAGWSPSLKRGVALGMVKGGRARIGEVLELQDATKRAVRIATPGAYDPEGNRLHA